MICSVTFSVRNMTTVNPNMFHIMSPRGAIISCHHEERSDVVISECPKRLSTLAVMLYMADLLDLPHGALM